MSRIALSRLAGLCLLILCGCSSTPSLVWNLSEANPKTPTAMVAKPLDRPLYIVLDKRVPDSWDLSQPERKVTLGGFQTFVTRDLKAALGPYFSGVVIVNDKAGLPTTPYALVEVAVDDVKLNYLDAGDAKRSQLEMRWSLSARTGEASEFAFTYSGSAVSRDNATSFEQATVQMTEAAVVALMRKWNEADALEKLRTWTQPGAAK
jgi:hypothetical protein